MTKFFLKLYQFFSAHRAAFYSVLIITTLVFAFFATRIKFEENILALLPQTDKSKECSVAFGNIKVKDKVFISLHSVSNDKTPQEVSGAMESFLSMLNENADGTYIDNILYRFDTDDIMNVVYYAMGALPCHLDESFYETCDEVLKGKPYTEIGIPDLGGAYTMIDGYLFSPDSTLAVAYLAPAYSTLDTKKGNEFEVIISKCVRKFQQENPDFEVLYHGTGIQGTFNSRQIKKDLIITVGISLILILFLFGICFKSKRSLLYLLSPLLYGTLFSLAVVYWIQGTMSFIAIGIGSVIIGVALSYVLHVVVHHKFRGDIVTVLKEESRPVCLGCITTIGAFAGLLFTSSALLKDFGLFASFQLIGTTFFALGFLPQFIKGSKSYAKNEKAFEIIGKINRYPVDRNRVVVIFMTALCITGIIGSRFVKFDSDLNNIGYLEPKMVKSEQLFDSKMNRGQFSVYYAAHAEDEDEAITYSRTLDDILDSLQKQGVINSYSGTKGLLVPQAEQENNIVRWKEYWTPEKVDKAYAILKREADKNDWYTATGMDIPETFKLMTMADYYPQDLYNSGAIPDALLCNFLEYNDDGWLVFSNVMMDKKNLSKVNDAVASRDHMLVLDPFYYTGDMVDIIHDDFNFVLLFSSIFVFLVLLISYRSLIISIIAFMPMMLSWYIVQGLMAIFGLEFNLINIMISTFIFGIGVDYSIFVMDGLLGMETGRSDHLLEFHKTAIFFSGVTLMIVIGSLLFATHPAIYSIGISTIIGMASTIMISYALQPLVFRIVMKNNYLRRKVLKIK